MKSYQRGVWLTSVVSLLVLAALIQGAGSAVAQLGAATLTVDYAGNGAGTVYQISGPGNNTPQGINCSHPARGLGNVCSESLALGAPPQPFIGLQASAPVGSEFIGWDVEPGDAVTFDCDASTDCYVQVAGDVTVTAQFQQVSHYVPLQVSRRGPGAQLGLVTSSPNGIHCGLSAPDCATSYPGGTQVTLSATGTNGATFGSWSGACSSFGSSPTCIVAMSEATWVVANFNAPQETLNVAVQGSGGVSGWNISCPSTCQASLAQGSQVELYATPATNFRFVGWSGGGCSGQGICTVTLNAPTTVTATFAQITQQLNVDVDGSGKVVSTPAEINCPGACQGPFAQGSRVTLAADPATGYKLSGWSGAGCSGTGSCVVTMSQAQAVEATFGRAPVQASFSRAQVRANGPKLAQRSVAVFVSGEETVGIKVRILRGGSQLKQASFRRQEAGPHTIVLLLPNRVAAGDARVQVTFTNMIGTQKVQSRPIRLPRVAG
jgi:Divergent InlB B-repeat domain